MQLSLQVWEETRKLREADKMERVALQQRFTDAISDIQEKMDQQNEARQLQLQENVTLREKLAEFLKQVRPCFLMSP